jgi:hypothetical protein
VVSRGEAIRLAVFLCQPMRQHTMLGGRRWATLLLNCSSE